MVKRAFRHLSSHLFIFLGLFAVVAAGTAWAATAPKNSVTSKSIRNGQVKTADIAKKAVNGSRVKPDSLGGTQVNEASLSSAILQRRITGICTDGLAVSSVNSDGTVSCAPAGGPPSGPAGGDLAGAYPGPSIALGAITAAKLANASVTNAKLADDAVTSSRVADNSLTGQDIDESTLGTVPDAAKLDGVASTGFLKTGDTAGGDVSGVFSNMQLGAGVVGNAELGDNSVTSPKVLNDTLTGNDIDESTLGNVPSATIATSAIAAFNATNATTALLANNADNSDKLDNLDSTAFALAGSSAPPSGAAGGDLTGTYPNPSIAGNAVNSAKVAPGSLGVSDVDTSSIQARVTGMCPPGRAVQSVAFDGTVGCGAFWSLAGNSGTTPASDFIGTTDNQELRFRVNNVNGLRLEPIISSGTQFINVVGGQPDNTVTSGAVAATIGGGGDPAPYANKVTDNYGTVSGGANNQAGNGGSTSDHGWATVGGGSGNRANGGSSTIGGGTDNVSDGNTSTVSGGQLNNASAQWATVGGGGSNRADGQLSTVAGGDKNYAVANWSAIGGGDNNQATGFKSTIAGGSINTASGTSLSTVGGGGLNTASGANSTVPGGQNNTAAGVNSFAAGYNAKANHNGSFVWADRVGTDFPSTADNEFSARATGGVRFVSAVDGSGVPTAGVQLASGGGSWSSLSDRNAKMAISPLSGGDVLRKLAAIPVSEWSYRAQGSGVRHIGPMAQDFHRAFGLGESSRYIDTVDSEGVALAAIKGLNAKLDRRIRKMSRQIRELRRAVRDN